MSGYTGIYVRRLTDGTIYSVRVRHGRDEIEVDPESYLSGGGQPPFHHLPDRYRRLTWTPPVGYIKRQELGWGVAIEGLALVALRFVVLWAFGLGALWGVVLLFKWMWEHSQL
jgi:hypothetical protein